jgi:hypothetical protein
MPGNYQPATGRLAVNSVSAGVLRPRTPADRLGCRSARITAVKFFRKAVIRALQTLKLQRTGAVTQTSLIDVSGILIGDLGRLGDLFPLFMDCWTLLLPLLRLLRCKGLLHCPVEHTVVQPTRLAKCWDRCTVRGCIPIDIRRRPQRLRTNKLKLVMTHVEEVHVAEDLTVCEPPTVTGSEAAAQVLYPFFEEHLDMYEAMRLMLLDNSKRAKGVVTIGQGGIARMVADHRLIFAAALKTLTPSIILAHNHPSGRV